MAGKPSKGARTAVLPEGGRASAPAPAPRHINERLADRGEIARGGQGVVRKVFDKRLERYVALKVMDSNLAGDADARGRFLDEARIDRDTDQITLELLSMA